MPKAQLREAEDLMFQRHPAMRQWPKDHGFQLCVIFAAPNAQGACTLSSCAQNCMEHCTAVAALGQNHLHALLIASLIQ